MAFVEDFTKAMAATDKDGRLLHKLQDVEDFLALLILTSPVKDRGVDEEATMLLGRFAQRAKIQLGADEAAVSAAVDAYFKANPLNDDVVKAAAKVAASHLAQGAKGTVGEAFKQFAGDATSKGVLGGGERP